MCSANSNTGCTLEKEPIFHIQYNSMDLNQKLYFSQLNGPFWNVPEQMLKIISKSVVKIFLIHFMAIL